MRSAIPEESTAAEFAGYVELEHEQIELKSGAGRRPLQDTQVAFSNSDGGDIVIGVSDDRRLIGRRRDQGIDDDIHGAAADATNVGRIAIREVHVDGVPLVVVHVEARADDVAATSDGRVLVRRGGHNRALTPREVAELYASRASMRYELTDSGVGTASVDEQFSLQLAAAFGWTEAAQVRARWHERGLLNVATGNLTIAGALILTNPSATLAAAKFRVDVRVYETDTGTSYINRDLVDGPVQRQVEIATRLVERSIGTEMVITGARRHDVPRLPRRVVREAIANAVAHRTYEVDATPVVIEVRPSSVKVTSPGGLPDSVTVPTLRHAQAPRNHSIIEALRGFGLAEDGGQGIDIIEDSMRLELLAEPVFDDSGTSFSVELSLKGLVSTTERAWLAEFERSGLLKTEERLLLVALAREGRMTNARARDLLKLDSTNVRTRLHRLRDAGILVQHGTRGRANYTLGALGPERSDQQVTLDAAADGPITNQRVREITGLDRVAARSLLKRLVDEDRLAQHGERRGTFYTLP